MKDVKVPGQKTENRQMKLKGVNHDQPLCGIKWDLHKTLKRRS